MRYSCSRKVQNDKLGGFLFSVNSKKVLRLSENGNGDICVADPTGKAVFVMYAFKELRFSYTGSRTLHKRINSFEPLDIINNGNFDILISDESNNLVHIIDFDGNFIRYLECPCNGGFSVDSDHNLVVGESTTGKIRVIKYLE